MIIPAGLAFNNFVVVAVLVASFYFAREILVPIALAVLLSFVLVPLVKLLQRVRIPRPFAVLLAVGAALAVAISLGTMVMLQVNQLISDLPRYQTTLGQKVHSLRDTLGPSGVLKGASNVLKDLGQELETNNSEKPPVVSHSLAQRDGATTPIPVEVHQPVPGASETFVAVLQPLVGPFTTTGIVLVFVTFFLFQREDLRNRFIRLVGSGDIERTTTALDDAGRRLGKLFATQLILNAIFGLVIGSGLALIGVPSAPLWGLLAMILRFVPYIGAVLAAVLPLTLAAAVDADWRMAIWTISLYAVVEVVMGQVVEPFIYGRNAGLSPVAIVISAAFWTWLWGPLGLLMSTPLTLCLAVLARHVDRLQFIDIMIGDQPALTPQQAAYQRMLTGDPVEAIEQARAFLKEGTVLSYYDDIVVGALRLAQADAEQGRLDDARLEKIFNTVSDTVEDLSELRNSETSKENLSEYPSTNVNVVPLSRGDFGKQVYCIPGLGRLDDCAVLLLADALKRQGIDARVAGATTAIENNKATSICLCYLEDVSQARLDYAVRKLSRSVPAARIVVCLLAASPEVGSDTQAGSVHPRSLKATIARFADPHASSNESSGTKGITEGSR